MNKNKLNYLIVGAIATIAVSAAVYQGSISNEAIEVESRSAGIYLPVGTNTPVAARPGIVVVRDNVNYAVSTPRPNQVGTHIEVRPNAYSPDAVATKIAQAASRGLDVWLSVALADNNSAAGGMDYTYLPTGWPTVVYNDGCGTLEAVPDYRSLIQYYRPWVKSFTDTYDSNPDVAGYVIGTGTAEELINAYNFPYCATKRTNLEKIVTCQDFIKFARDAVAVWKEYTDKPVTLASGGGAACIDDYSNRIEENNSNTFGYFFPDTPVPGTSLQGASYPTATPPYGVIYRSNGLHLGKADNWSWGSQFGRMSTGIRQSEIGGAAYEFGTTGYSQYSGCIDGFPCIIPTPQRVGYTSDSAFMAISAGAVNLFWQCHATYGCWSDYLSARAWNAITSTMGTNWNNSPKAWIRFRDAEENRVNNRSDWPGPFTHLITLSSSAEPTRYCEPSVYATAVAGAKSYSTPQVCEQELTSPTAPESRNVLAYNAGSAIYLDVDDRWIYRNNTSVFSVTWLSNGVTAKVSYTTSNATTSNSSIVSGNTGNWATNSATLTNSVLRNGFNENRKIGDIKIEVLTGTLYLYYAELACSTCVGITVPTPTPTHTPAPDGSAASTITKFNSIDSSTIARPNTSFSSSKWSVFVESDGFEKQNTLIRVNKLLLPNNATTVKRALLKLYLNGSSSFSKVYQISVGRLNKDWTNGDASWSNATDSVEWNVAGGLGAEDYSDKTVYAITPNSNGSAKQIELDITHIVRKWLIDGKPNYGVILFANQFCKSPCNEWISFASERSTIADYKPFLEVEFGYSVTVTPTATPTRTPTAIHTPGTATPTLTPTPTGTIAATQTPSISSLIINEVCPDPNLDHNLDGSITTDDAFIELLNWNGAKMNLSDYQLVFDRAQNKTYTFPSNVFISPFSYKVIYAYQLRNVVGDKFDIPNNNVVTIELKNNYGDVIDGVSWNKMYTGLCWGRKPNGSASWGYNLLPTLGKGN